MGVLSVKVAEARELRKIGGVGCVLWPLVRLPPSLVPFIDEACRCDWHLTRFDRLSLKQLILHHLLVLRYNHLLHVRCIFAVHCCNRSMLFLPPEALLLLLQSVSSRKLL